MNRIHPTRSTHRPSVTVGISSFRSDPAVLDIIQRIVDEEWPVDSVFVVDSAGTGAIQEFIRGRGLDESIQYYNSPDNLGSAGNLRRRLEIGVERGADFVLALNHDAIVDRATVEALLAHASMDQIGALYPLRFRSGKGIFDLTGTTEFAFRAHGVPSAPATDLVEVKWSSSNGALYSTAPLREQGLGPEATLWMGWEDYLYGLEMHENGYRQFIVVAASTIDNYEYKNVNIAGISATIADKPAWYIYYSIRNMILTNMHQAPSPMRLLKTGAWIIIMAGHVLKQDKRGFAISAYIKGLADGLRNKRGKWIHP